MAEIFDEEFNRYLDILQWLTEHMPNATDRLTASKWIKRMCALDSKSITVKKERNNFCKYFLKVLVRNWQDSQDKVFEEKKEVGESRPIIRRWSQDKRTYISMQPFAGGALIYLAMARKPELGWEQWGNRALSL